MPEPTLEELENRFIEKYGSKGSTNSSYFQVLVTLPLFLMVVITISCIWWSEHEKRKEEDRQKVEKAKLALITKAAVTGPPKPKIVSEKKIIENENLL